MGFLFGLLFFHIGGLELRLIRPSVEKGNPCHGKRVNRAIRHKYQRTEYHSEGEIREIENMVDYRGILE
mgnify:CR=1 FL=1